MSAERSSSPYFCLICSNEIQVAVTHCPLDDTNSSLLIIRCQEDFITFTCTHQYHLSCINKIQPLPVSCPLCSRNDYQHNEGVLAYGHTEIGETPLFFDNEFGNNTMSISANESINRNSDISYVSEYWYENGENLVVTYDQSPSTTVDKTPNIPREKKKKKKVEKDIIVLNHELLNSNDEPLETVRSDYVLTASYRMHHLAQLWEQTDNCDGEMRNTIREGLICYFLLGKNLNERYDELVNDIYPPLEAKKKIKQEIKSFFSGSDDLLAKKTEKARKIYWLFSAIGEDKIQRVRTISADTIARLTYPQLDMIKESVLQGRVFYPEGTR